MDKQLKFFSLHSIIFHLSFELNTLYASIFFYQQYKNSLVIAIGTYICIHALYSILIALFIKTIGIIGTRSSLIVAIIFFALSFYVLALIGKDPSFINLAFYIITHSIAKLYYHIPSHIYVAQDTKDKNRGSVYGLYTALIIFFTGFAIIVGGNILEGYFAKGYAILNIVILFISIIPLLNVKNKKFHYSGKLFSLLKLHSIKKLFRISLAHSFNSQAAMFWHIYVFLFFGSSYLNIGYFYSIVIIISSLAGYILGKYLDSHNRLKIFKNNAPLTALAWTFRAISITPILIFISDLIYKFNANLRNEAFDVVSYDLVNINNAPELFDEAIALREIILNLQAAFGLVIFLFVATTFGFQAAFLLAALSASLFYLV